MKSGIMKRILAFSAAAILTVPGGLPVHADEAEAAPVINDELISGMLSAGDYIEGEAIVLVRTGTEPGAAASIEELSEVDADTVELTLEEAEEPETEPEVPVEEAERRLMSAAAETYTIQHVTDPSRTTEELLRELYADPNVIAAEPNYVIEQEDMADADEPAAEAVEVSEAEAVEASEEESPETSEEEAPEASEEELPEEEDPEEAIPEETAEVRPILTTDPVGVSAGDLTPMQWYAACDESTSMYTTPISPSYGYSLNVPGWSEGRTDPASLANASGTICIMDTGLDISNPDIQNVLYEFTPEQQAEYGCGPYGMDASGTSVDPGEITDFNSHGTHVAGITAAQWNEFGTSGVAHGVRIFSVRIFGQAGSSDEASVIKGFRFLVDVAQETNLKAVNCSWGTMTPQFIYSVMVNALGKKGVNTVFASGNRGVDLDEDLDTGAGINSVYSINVNAASPDGQATDFTCRGQSSTDVFAPGAGMMSTVPEIINSGGEWYYDLTRFYPEATAAEDLVFGVERFSDGEVTVRFFDANPALSNEAVEIGATDLSTGFDDKYSIAVNVQSLKSSGNGPQNGLDTMNGSVFLAIPVESAADAKWISLQCAMSDSFKPIGTLESITCANAEGDPVTVDTTCSAALANGAKRGAQYQIYQCQWASFSCNIDAYISASNSAHEIISEHPDDEWLAENGYFGLIGYNDIGEVAGVYEWEDSGSKYIIAELGIGPNGSGSISESTTLYIDNVAVGGPNAFREAFLSMSGTSMAAPAVTGCLAVIARDEAPSWELTDDELEAQALERAAKLLASVDYDDSLSGLCRTGGRVNLHGTSDFSEKAPIIRRSSASGGVLTVEGYFFGSGGTLYIDNEAAEVTQWTDGKITADTGTLANGSHVVMVINSDGAAMRDRFSSSEDTASGKELYERSHSLPLDEPAYAEGETDRLCNSSVICGGSLYVTAAWAGSDPLKALWRYEIADDKWYLCSLPEGCIGQDIHPGSLAALNDTLYLYGMYDESGGVEPETGFWRYHPSEDEWEKIDMDLPLNALLCTCQDKLFLVDGYYPGKTKQPSFSIVDPEKKTLKILSGDLPGRSSDSDCAIAASDDKIWYFCNAMNDEGEEEYRFVRAEYDEAAGSVSAEDLTSVFTDALGGDLEYWKHIDDRMLIKHFSLAGLPDGVAIVGSSVPGVDTHVIYDDGNTAEVYERTSSYHTPLEPVAAYAGGWLYVLGYNTTEPDVMYFRSTNAAADRQKITDAELKYDSLVYTGKARTQTGTTIVKCGDAVLTKGADYKISYRNNINAGTAEMIITGKGAYKGTIIKEYEIAPAKITSASMSKPSMAYTGSAVKPTSSVVVKGKKNGELTALIRNTDYKLSYSNNTKVGTATVTVTGRGNYTGTKKVTFKIVPTKREFKSVEAGKKSITLKWTKKKPEARGYQYQVSTSKDFSSGVKSYRVRIADVSTAAITRTVSGLTSGKKYYVRLRSYAIVNGKNYYSGWSKKKSVTIK